MRGYPCKRVVISFALCPALYGVVSLMVVLYYGYNDAVSNSDFFMLMVLALAMSVLSAIVVVLVCLPVSLLLGFIYVLLRLKRGWIGCFICFLSGGSGSYLWWYFIYPYRESSYMKSAFLDSTIHNGLSTLIMGAFFSLVVSFWALPSRNYNAS